MAKNTASASARSFVTGYPGPPGFQDHEDIRAVLSWRPVKRALSIGSPNQ
jgi:hypothetical protein